MTRIRDTAGNFIDTVDLVNEEVDLGGLATEQYVDTAVAGKANIVNTDDDPGRTIYVGATDPAAMDPPATLAAGDIWIDTGA